MLLFAFIASEYSRTNIFRIFANSKRSSVKYKNYMTEDILHRIRRTNQCPNVDFTSEMYNEALVLIEDLYILISNLPLSQYGMLSPDRPAADLVNTDLQREKQYNDVDLATIIVNNEPLQTSDQKNIYNRIMLTVDLFV